MKEFWPRYNQSSKLVLVVELVRLRPDLCFLDPQSGRIFPFSQIGDTTLHSFREVPHLCSSSAVEAGK